MANECSDSVGKFRVAWCGRNNNLWGFCTNTEYLEAKTCFTSQSFNALVISHKCNMSTPSVIHAQLLRLKNATVRPLIVHIDGEVFFSKKNALKICQQHDIIMSRALTPWSDIPNCNLIHSLQGISHSYRPSITADGYRQMLKNISESRNTQKMSIPKTKTKFACLITASVYKKMYKSGTALVRHAACRLLDNKNVTSPQHCHRLEHVQCPGNDLQSYLCMRPYKFSVTMENNVRLGYISEKLFNGIFSDTIPIYFGAPDIGRYINLKRIVYCNITSSIVKNLQHSDIVHQITSIADSKKIQWATTYLEKPLSSCIHEVLRLNSNKNAYLNKLNAPLWKSHIFHNGSYEKQQLYSSYARLNVVTGKCM